MPRPWRASSFAISCTVSWMASRFKAFAFLASSILPAQHQTRHQHASAGSFGTVGQDFAQQFCELGSMLSFLKSVTLPSFGDFRVAFTVGNAAHGQVHANFAALAVKVLAQALDDIFRSVLGDTDNMLGHIGIIGLFDELGSGSLADGAEIGDGALSNVAADSANILFIRNTSESK